MEPKTINKIKILCRIPEKFNYQIEALQTEEKKMNSGKQMRTKAEQIIRLAQIGLKTLNEKS